MPEEIPDNDDVSRHLFEPWMGSANADLIWHNVFMFKTENNFKESLVWRKYAPQIADVHELGCAKQRADRDAGRDCTYFGALTGNAGRIRGIRSKNGAGLEIVHAPDQGIHHAHIGYLPDTPLSKSDKAELKKALKDEFLERSEHTCPEVRSLSIFS